MTFKENPYKIALVGIDLTPMDDTIIDYLPILLQALPIERVIFVHIAEGLELPLEVIESYPDLIAPLDESISSDIHNKVSPVFEDSDASFDIIVREGKPLENFLRLSKIKNADLIVMGRKKQLEGSGLLAGNVVRKSPTSMLLITEGFTPRLNKVLLPVDFSRHSRLAVGLSKIIKERVGVSLSYAHVYSVPKGYYKTGKTYKEFADIMKSHAERDLKNFCRENQLDEDDECDYILNKDVGVANLIYKHASKVQADMVLIGSRGRTNTSALLLGSIVEKLAIKDADIPLLVVKNKGESMTFLESIMKL